MDDVSCLFEVLEVACVLSGPIALVISIIALKRLREVRPEARVGKPRTDGVPRGTGEWLRKITEQQITAPPEVVEKPQKQIKEETPPEVVKALSVEEKKGAREKIVERDKIQEKTVPIGLDKAAIERARMLLEQRIGTRWILIAGVITTFVGVAFFLRYAYLHFSLTDLEKVIIAAVGGFVCLAVGEITRRRGYEIVAKGVTALGFAILYASVFTAQQFYGLIGSRPAFVLGAAITAAAMVYAVVLDEILIAFLSLLGGFLTPVIVSTGENLPMPLFTYVAILSVGAMLCAYYRKWRAVDVLAFIGTFLLYAGWFEKFYRPAMGTAERATEQLGIALGWLGTFFGIYLVLPILYELAKKVEAKKEDVLLVLANATVVFYYLWTILFDEYRMPLALCAVGLCAAHLNMMGIVIKRCKQDVNLRHVLLVISLFFLTIAIPIYFKMYVITIAWAAEATILAIIGLRYRSVLTQIGGAVALFLSCGNLLIRLPMHTEQFSFVFNAPFGTWCFVAGIMFVCHIIYRRTCESSEDPYGVVAQTVYTLALAVLFAAATMEWYCHCSHNMADGANQIWRGQMLIFAATVPLFVIWPIRPPGKISDALAGASVVVGSVFALRFFILTNFHKGSFRIIANPDFGVVLAFIAAVCIYHVICRRLSASPNDQNGQLAQASFGLIGLLLFAAATMEWYCHCKYNLMTGDDLHYILRGQVIVFAAVMLLFSIRPVCPAGKLSDVLSMVLLASGSIFIVYALRRLHTGSFIIFANLDFAIILVFIAAVLVCHIKYRLISEPAMGPSELVSQAVYGILGLLLLSAVAAEWYWHCVYNLQAPGLTGALMRGQVIIFSLIMLMFIIRPVCPRGIVPRILATILAVVGAAFSLIAFPDVHDTSYLIFANADFGAVILFVVALFTSAWLLNRWREREQYARQFAIVFMLFGIFVLWALLNEEIYLYWYCRNRFLRPQENWEFLAHMYISVMWAVYGAILMVAGFWRKSRMVRFIAIGLFVILLAKVFVWDTRTIANVYRIAAFLATGVTLVAVSYLYQFLKKKGFFEAMLAAKDADA